MLVEIIIGKETGDEALAAALDYVRAIRKTPIVVNDSRGFYANRCVLGNYIREGHLMLLEGMPAAMIENVGAHGRHAGRPAALNDEIALDLGLKIVQGDRSRSRRRRDRSAAEEAAGGDGREARPARPQERQGLLRLSGRRAEAAVARPRRTAAEEARRRQIDASTSRSSSSACSSCRRSRPRAPSRRRCVTDVREADVGSILGFGFAPFTGGTLSYIDMMGTKKFVALCQQARGEIRRRASRRRQAAGRHGRARARASTAASRRRSRRRRLVKSTGATMPPIPSCCWREFR